MNDTALEVIETDTPETGANAIMRLVDRALTDPAFDVAKLDHLLQVHDRWEANEARKAFIAARAAFQAKVPKIQKTRTGHNTKYAGLAETIAAVRDVMAQHNLSHSWETQQEGDLITVTCTLTHIGGHSEKTALSAAPDTSGSKNAIQAVGSTVSYLQRYTLYSALGLASADQDDDGKAAGGDVISDEQKTALIKLLKETDTNTQSLLKVYGVESIDALPSANFAAAEAMLKSKKAKKEGDK